MGVRAWLRGDDLAAGSEQRTPTRCNVPPSMLPYSRSALLNVNTTNALRVADAYSCVRVLADSVASLPPKVYRRTTAGRVPGAKVIVEVSGCAYCETFAGEAVVGEDPLPPFHPSCTCTASAV